MAESRGMSIIRSNDGSILVRAVLFDAADAKITDAVSDAVLRVWHVLPATGLLETYDYNDNTFKAGAITTATVDMTYAKAENNTYDTGLWTHRLTTLTPFVVGDKYVLEVDHASLSREISMEFQYGDHEGDDGRDFLCRGPELAAAVGTNSITLDGAAPGTLNYYNGCFVKIVEGTGEGQVREILHYTAARIAYVKPWTTALGASSKYVILPKDHNSFVVNAGMATGGAAGYILLAAHAEALVDSTYNGMMVVITGGTGVGQSRIINSYDATGAGSGERYATVTRSWVTAPDNTSTYVIFPLAAEDQVDLIWDESTNSHTTMGSAARALTHGAIRSYEQGQAHAVITEFKLNAGASATPDLYNGCLLVLLSGTGAGQARIIQSYAATRIATVRAWTTAPDGSEYYVVLAKDNMTETDNVWDELNAGHTTAATTGLHLSALGAAIAARTFNSNLNALLGVTDLAGLNVSDMVWDEAGAGHTTATTEGGYLSALGAAIAGRTFNPTLNALLAVPDLAAHTIADPIWDEGAALHVVAGSVGNCLHKLGFDIQGRTFNSNLNALLGVPDTALTDTVAGQVWQETVIAHNAAGTMGEVMNLIVAAGFPSVATISDGVWDEDIVAAHGAASAAGLLLRVLGGAISTRANNATLNALLGVADIAAYTIAETVWLADAPTYAAANCTGLVLSACGLAISQRANNATLNALLGVPDVAANNIAETIWDEVVNAASHNVVDSAGRRLWTIDDRTEVGGSGDLAYILAQATKIDQGACDSPATAGSVADKLDDLTALVMVIDRDIVTSCNIEGNNLRIEVAVEQYGVITTGVWDQCVAQIFDETNAIIANIGAGDFGAVTARGFFQYTWTPHTLAAGKTYQVQVTVTDTGVPTSLQTTKLIKVTNV